MLSLVIVVFLQLDDYAIPWMFLSSTFSLNFNSTTKLILRSKEKRKIAARVKIVVKKGVDKDQSFR
ncbi:hypothetical protein KDW_10990 [Dictyobacter vulcani]|uniref:Uncharacterized protein n=1 Tax=Dictyobacter vulcani TaxID=2607529 RepID=A0A5J4KKH2_9CHLR|nr:hypothetical protein KDW_10990 [Dictyobacter vulcani]